MIICVAECESVLYMEVFLLQISPGFFLYSAAQVDVLRGLVADAEADVPGTPPSRSANIPG